MVIDIKFVSSAGNKVVKIISLGNIGHARGSTKFRYFLHKIALCKNVRKPIRQLPSECACGGTALKWK